MKEFKGNNGKWEVGKEEMTVISDSRNNIPTDTGHDDIQYYGGYLIAESIYNKEDAKLIAAAPELLEALQDLVFTATKLWEDVSPIKSTDTLKITHPIIEQAKEAINKALGL